MFNKPLRNHPTYILEKIGASFLFLALLAGNMLTANTQNMADLFSLHYWKMIFSQVLSGNFSVLLGSAGIMIFLFVVICVSALRWSRTFFHIEDELLFSERRTMLKKTSKLPVNSITTVNISQNLFEKIVGTAKVKIDINSAATADKSDFVFILKLSTAQQFKDALLSAQNKKEVQQDLPHTMLASFSTADALRHQLLSIPLVQIATAIAVFLPMFVGETAVLKDALTALAVSAVMYAGSLVFGVLNLADFRLETDGKRIFISHGKLRTQNYAFEKTRVKAVFLKQSLLARLFGFCSVELAVVGLGNEKNESPRLCLLVKKDRAQRLIDELLPAYTSKKKAIVSEKAALIPAFLLTALATAVVFAFTWGFPPYGYILSGAVLVLGIVSGVLSQKTRTISLEENLICCSSGILNKKTGRFLYRDIQEARLHTNVLMQKGNFGRIGFSILSAKNVSMQKTGWFKAEIYDELSRKILK